MKRGYWCVATCREGGGGRESLRRGYLFELFGCACDDVFSRCQPFAHAYHVGISAFAMYWLNGFKYQLMQQCAFCFNVMRNIHSFCIFSFRLYLQNSLIFKQREFKQRTFKQRDFKQRSFKQRSFKQRNFKQRNLKQRDIKQRDIKQRDIKQRNIKKWFLISFIFLL